MNSGPQCERGFLVNTILQAAVHLGQEQAQHVRFVHHFWSLTKLFEETEILIKNHTDIIDLS